MCWEPSKSRIPPGKGFPLIYFCTGGRLFRTKHVARFRQPIRYFLHTLLKALSCISLKIKCNLIFVFKILTRQPRRFYKEGMEIHKLFQFLIKSMFLVLQLELCHAQSLGPVQLFCNPTDPSSPGSPVYWILQARVQAWVSISFSRGSSLPRSDTCISCFSCILHVDSSLLGHLGSLLGWMCSPLFSQSVYVMILHLLPVCWPKCGFDSPEVSSQAVLFLIYWYFWVCWDFVAAHWLLF